MYVCILSQVEMSPKINESKVTYMLSTGRNLMTFSIDLLSPTDSTMFLVCNWVSVNSPILGIIPYGSEECMLLTTAAAALSVLEGIIL